ncbi:hypothetical protein [Myroides guanonis]|uniref:DUF4304 domain-containing protein n=1 Tax=Myroides guanonis TaxID=1150112 RepID=A0A1I3U2C9_9FLAO|nr:hypothetical protein [Myroides guanonis]SFJ76689.1 hypothetical protein SAMN04487893_11583 [Myroides guanonis]
MNWEDLKSYKPLEKGELSNAKISIENIVTEKLEPFGFRKFGRKLIRKSNDIVHIIHLDSRGSWQGSSSSLKTEFAIVSIFDTDILIENFEPISSSYIQHLEPKLKNYYQITKEFNLFAEYLSRKIIEIILPHLDKYLSSKDVLKEGIKLGGTKNLEQFCRLINESNEKISAEQLKAKKDAVLKKLKISE